MSKRLWLASWPNSSVTIVWAESIDNAKRILEKLYEISINDICLKEIYKDGYINLNIQNNNKINIESSEIQFI